MFYSYPRDSKDLGSSQLLSAWFGPSLTKAEILFPADREEDGHLIDVMVIIKDAYGESVKNKLQIQVSLVLQCFKPSCCYGSEKKLSICLANL